MSGLGQDTLLVPHVIDLLQPDHVALGKDLESVVIVCVVGVPRLAAQINPGEGPRADGLDQVKVVNGEAAVVIVAGQGGHDAWVKAASSA